MKLGNNNLQLNPKIREDLFSTGVSRNKILECELEAVGNSSTATVNVWRNSGVEAYVPILEKYLNYFGFNTSFSISSYDSSFDLRGREPADLDLIYISIEDLDQRLILDLLRMRIKQLMNSGTKHVSLAIQVPPQKNLLDSEIDGLKMLFPDIKVLLISEENVPTGTKFQDRRLLDITANWLTADVYTHFGQLIALNLILPFLMVDVKMLVLDLDNTLYTGVLAEDGESGIAQSEFQEQLLSWVKLQKENGILIGVVSRNVMEDVRKLFQRFPGWELIFDFVHASWQPKEIHFQQILVNTRISEDAILFIDDSIFEVINVQNSFPKVQAIVYTDDESTLNLIKSYPGIGARKFANTQKIDRVTDLKSSGMRDSIFSSMSDKDAFMELQVQLVFELNNTDLIPRTTELSNKTNQFNFALNRYTEFEVKSLLETTDNYIVLSSLRDKYADSGVVSLISMRYSTSAEIEVNEFCISCRALGRGLEDEIFFGSLSRVLRREELSELGRVIIFYRKGDRNSPALNWARDKNWEIESDRVVIPMKALMEWQTLITSG